MTFTRDKETHDISLQVKVLASEAAKTLTANGKADRKSAVNTQFQRSACA